MAAPPPARRTPALMDELVEEILLRIPPDDPVSLARAAIVCKRWCRLITNPGFQRRFRQHHRTPMLGFIASRHRSAATGFLPTSSFRPSDADCRTWCPVDARHGRILFYCCCDQHVPEPDWSISRTKQELIVWTPAAGRVTKLPMIWFLSHGSSHWNAALHCTAPGCNHMECPSGGPFNVVLVRGNIWGDFIYAYVYSSKNDEWIKKAEIELPEFVVPHCTYSALVRDALYFLLDDNQGLLEYNMSKKELSVIMLPPICTEPSTDGIVLMTVEDNGLGFAMVLDFSLHIWLRESVPTPSGGWTWTQHRVVHIKSFLPVSALSSSPYVLATADTVGVFVIWAGDAGVLAIDIESKKVRKVSDGDDEVENIIPFISFCTPAPRATSINEEPTRGASTYP